MNSLSKDISEVNPEEAVTKEVSTNGEEEIVLPELNNRAQWVFIEQSAAAGNPKSIKLLEMKRVKLAKLALTTPITNEIPLTNDQKIKKDYQNGRVGDK